MRKIVFVLGFCLLAGCGAENSIINEATPDKLAESSHAEQQDLNDPQKLVTQKYREAIIKHQQKMAPIAKYIDKVCRPKKDKQYIACMNEKKAEIIANSLFPDLEIKMFEQINGFEQQLISKQINRKKFTEELERLGKENSYQVNDRAVHDIKTGIYTGKL